MANIQVAGTSSRGLREYRKGNWTIEETMVLIEAKKLDEERRLIMKRDQTSSSSSSSYIEGGVMNMVRSKPAAAAELRWKWIEDYCWTKSCLRSQNQCNDKWDNLMRDFKKVRDYENNNVDSSDQCCSYWKMERRERKDKNLPSNILPQIYEALVQVVERKGGGQRGVNVMMVGGGGGGCGSSCAATTTTSSIINPNMSFVMPTPPATSILQQQQQYLSNSQPLHLPLSVSIAALPLPPLPSPPPPPQLPLPTVAVDNTETSSGDHDDETNNKSDTPSKRRRRISNAIKKSASVIAEAVQASEESEERRHRDLMSVQQRRLQIEETKAEIHKQGINGLTDAINKLANSIHALASHNQPPNPPPPPPPPT